MNLTCFLMMPFSGTQQSVLFENIERAITRYNQTSQHVIVLDRADLTPPLQIDNLEEHLKRIIDASDFAIAEISQLNPNVLFELGYAIGVGKPVVVLMEEGIEPPADFRGKYFLRYSSSELNLLPQTLRPHIEAAVNSVIAERDAPRYKSEVWASRSLADVLGVLRRAERQIDILTTNLTSLSAGDFLNVLCDRLTSQPTLRVRILAHDPESVFVTDRAQQLGFDARHFRDELRRSADLILITMAPFQRQCQVALYDEFPTQITIRIDNAIYYTVVSATQQARNNLTFKIDVMRRGVAESIVWHFDTIWRRGRIVLPSADKPIEQR